MELVPTPMYVIYLWHNFTRILPGQCLGVPGSGTAYALDRTIRWRKPFQTASKTLLNAMGRISGPLRWRERLARCMSNSANTPSTVLPLLLNVLAFLVNGEVRNYESGRQASVLCGCNFTIRFGGNFVLAKVNRGPISVRCSELRGVCFSEVRNVWVPC